MRERAGASGPEPSGNGERRSVVRTTTPTTAPSDASWPERNAMEAIRPNLAFIPAAAYARLVDVVTERGHTRAEILAAARIDADVLADEQGCLTLAQVEALLGHVFELEPAAELAHAVGKRTTLMSHGWLTIAALSAPTLGDALALVAEHFALVCPLLTVSLHEERGHTKIQLTSACSTSRGVESFHLAMLLTSIKVHVPNVSRAGALPAGLRVAAALHRPGRPSWADALGIEVAYEPPHHELTVPTLALAARLPLADARVHAMSVRRCRAELEARPSPSQTAASVRSVLHESGPPFLDLAATAKRLAMSSRSLRRRLRAEGTSFRSVLDEVRSTFADLWLEDPTRSITEIGLDLGYTDSANFARAYRRTNGLSPSAARKRWMSPETSLAGATA